MRRVCFNPEDKYGRIPEKKRCTAAPKCKQTQSAQSWPHTPRRCEGTFCAGGLFNLEMIKVIAFDLWKNHVLFFDLSSDLLLRYSLRAQQGKTSQDGWLGPNTQFIVSLSTHLQGWLLCSKGWNRETEMNKRSLIWNSNDRCPTQGDVTQYSQWGYGEASQG